VWSACVLALAACRDGEAAAPVTRAPAARETSATPSTEERDALPELQRARLAYLFDAATALRRQWPGLADELPCVVLVDLATQWSVGCVQTPDAGWRARPEKVGARAVSARRGSMVTLGGRTLPTRDWLRREVATAWVAPPAAGATRAAGGVVWVATLEAMRALREDFADCATDEWLSVALHELFHAWQLRSPAFAAELRAIDEGALSPAAIRATFERDAHYRDRVQREYASLVTAVSGDTGHAGARAALRRWYALYRQRRAYLASLPDGPQLVRADRVFTGLEGLARYVESRFLVDASLHPAGAIEGDASFHRFARYSEGSYAAMQNRQLDAAYDYAIGFHLALLLDVIEPGWRASVTGEPGGLLVRCEALATGRRRL